MAKYKCVYIQEISFKPIIVDALGSADAEEIFWEMLDDEGTDFLYEDGILDDRVEIEQAD